ncbi:glycosyltransferase family 2 protein [Actinomycetaceae bacterium MB13-C1-2]|nr:glycosyltransferase family 2 protein [Actinomycetaceae bacterium MB13-C1-2]
MTLLTAVVPCFNAEAYMKRAVDSLLTGGESVEIIIVDDGSTDQTGHLADRYAKQFPDLVRVVHKANGGHGSAVNVGIEQASGKYLKVIDADDWLDPQAYAELIALLQKWEDSGDQADLIVSNFVYEKQGKRHKKAVRYIGKMPDGELFGWERLKTFNPWQYMVMHSMVYRTAILRQSGLKLPEHSFYVDNLYAFVPLPSVKVLYYLNVDLYRYWTGREDQSVNERVMLRRIDQQIVINERMFDVYSSDLRDCYLQPNLMRYMLHYLSVLSLVTSVLCKLDDDPELQEKGKAMWARMAYRDPKLAQKLRMLILGHVSHAPIRPTRVGYRIARAVMGFN